MGHGTQKMVEGRILMFDIESGCKTRGTNDNYNDNIINNDDDNDKNANNYTNTESVF